MMVLSTEVIALPLKGSAVPGEDPLMYAVKSSAAMNNQPPIQMPQLDHLIADCSST